MSEQSKEKGGYDFGSPIANLSRYFVAAEKMALLYHETLRNPEISKALRECNLSDSKACNKLMIQLHSSDYGVFMLYWCAALYVVIEGFRKLKRRDEKIEELLRSPNVDALRLLRNATFHFQNEFVSPKVMTFLRAKGSGTWLRSLTEAFSEYFTHETTQ